MKIVWVFAVVVVVIMVVVFGAVRVRLDHGVRGEERAASEELPQYRSRALDGFSAAGSACRTPES